MESFEATETTVDRMRPHDHRHSRQKRNGVERVKREPSKQVIHPRARGWSLSGYRVPKDERYGHLVLVAECPSQRWSGRPEHVLTGPSFSGTRTSVGHLAELFGFDFVDYFVYCDRVNIAAHYVAKWTQAKQKEARARAKILLSEVYPHYGQELVLLGRQAARAFGIPDQVELGQTVLIDEVDGGMLGPMEPACCAVRAHVMPHPSRRNRWWSDPGNREKAVEVLRVAADRARADYLGGAYQW